MTATKPQGEDKNTNLQFFWEEWRTTGDMFPNLESLDKFDSIERGTVPRDGEAKGHPTENEKPSK